MRLVVIVSDDGEGASDVRSGIGLANTRARLQQLYGARQSVTIRTAMGQGFAVELQMPLRLRVAELTVLIVDDEPGSRSRIRNLLKEERDVAIAGECADGDAAVEAIQALAPSLVFLDVQMPGIDGFEVLRRLDVETMPVIIFVTAFDQYAVEAFEVRALDYLVKPVRRERFAHALQRAREALRSGRAEWRQRAQTLVNRVVLRTRNRILLVPAETIDWIEAAGNYARVHVGAEAHLLRETMGTIEERLDPKLFVRTHRRAIVNVERIREVVAVARGEYSLLLHSGARVPLSRAYRSRLEFLLGSL